jgi:dipicolinate synthase subunit A
LAAPQLLRCRRFALFTVLFAPSFCFSFEYRSFRFHIYEFRARFIDNRARACYNTSCKIDTEDLKMEKKNRRFDYKWVVVALCFMMVLVCLGFCSSPRSLMIDPISKALGIDRSVYSITDSCRYASFYLEQSGITLTDHISPDITHLLLDIPSFDETGLLRNGQNLQEILPMLPESVTIIGGNLYPDYLTHYDKIDLLKNPYFQSMNAAITAECALQVAANYLNTTFADSPSLILGWGRIGKCLAKLLQTSGCSVTVAARKEYDRAMATALGYHTLDYDDIPAKLSCFRILFNTVPHQTIPAPVLNLWKDGIKLDLASYPGLICDDIIAARGLPGKYAPESAGQLIAKSVRSALKEEKS